MDHQEASRSLPATRSGLAADSMVRAALRVDVIRDTARLDALRPDWERIHAAMGATRGESFNPFMSWSWMAAWWTSHRGGGLWRQPAYRLHVLTLRDDRDVVRGIVPLVVARWGAGPLAIRAARLFGFGPATAELRRPLVEPTWAVPVADALADHLAGRAVVDHDLTIVDGLGNDVVAERLATRARVQGWSWGPDTPSYLVRLPDDWDAYRGGFRGHLRKSVRHGYNSLARDGHAWTFEAVADPEEIATGLDDLFRMHRARAARGNRPRHIDYYAKAEDRAALREVAMTMAADGAAVLCRLRVDGSTVAVRLAFVGDGAIYLHDAGSDSDWSHYAVATTLTAECLRWAIGRGIGVAFLGTGDDPSKARWHAEQRVLRRLHVVAPTARGALLAVVMHLPRLVRTLAIAAVSLGGGLPVDALGVEVLA